MWHRRKRRPRPRQSCPEHRRSGVPLRSDERPLDPVARTERNEATQGRVGAHPAPRTHHQAAAHALSVEDDVAQADPDAGSGAEPEDQARTGAEVDSEVSAQVPDEVRIEGEIGAKIEGRAVPGQTCGLPTFDDGPSRFTQQVLDILNRYQAKATFFVLGANVVDNPSLVRAAARDGMSIQNHSWDHPDLSSRSNDEIRSQIRRTDNAIRNAGGGNSTCVRPPYGATNARVRAVLGDMDKRQLLWTIDTLDWERPGASAIYRRAVEEVGRGSIVLAHDGGGVRTQTVAALPRILENLKDRGYRFGTLCQ